MKFNRDWLDRVYLNEAGADGADAGSSGVQTDADATVDSSTLLTDVQTDSDVDADAAADDTVTDDTVTDSDTDVSDSTPPDTYADFVMPEGIELDSALLAEASPLFKELGLNQEQAQKLVDFQASQVKASSESQVDAFNQLMTDWQDKSKSDKEFGGDKFEESVKIAQSAVNRFGTPELKQLLEEHGVGNHPEVIRFMVKVGKLTAEDVPGAVTTPTSTAGDRVSLLYPK